MRERLGFARHHANERTNASPSPTKDHRAPHLAHATHIAYLPLRAQTACPVSGITEHTSNQVYMCRHSAARARRRAGPPAGAGRPRLFAVDVLYSLRSSHPPSPGSGVVAVDRRRKWAKTHEHILANIAETSARGARGTCWRESTRLGTAVNCRVSFVWLAPVT